LRPGISGADQRQPGSASVVTRPAGLSSSGTRSGHSAITAPDRCSARSLLRSNGARDREVKVAADSFTPVSPTRPIRSPLFTNTPRSIRRGIAARWKYCVKTCRPRGEMRTNSAARGVRAALDEVDDAVVDRAHVLAPDLAAQIDAAVPVPAFDGAVARAHGAEHARVAAACGASGRRAGATRLAPSAPAR
jgi:hypothetical protein